MKASFLVLYAIVIVFCIGCERHTKIPERMAERERDSVVYFYERSKDGSLQALEKIFFIDRSLARIKDNRDTLLLKVLFQKIYLHNTLRQYDSSRHYADELIKYAKLQEDTLYLARGYYRKGRIFIYLNDPEESFKNAIASKKFYQAVGDSSEVGRRLLEMAIAQGQLGDYSGSQESAVESLSYLNSIKDSVYLSSAYNCIAISYRKQKLYDQAIEEYRNALKFTSSVKDSIIVLNNIVNVHRDKKEFDQAVKILEGIDADRLDENPVILARIIDNLAYTRWLRDPDLNILKELEKALKIRLENKDMEGLQANYAHLSDFFRSTNRALAIAYAKKSLDISIRYKNPQGRIDALGKLVYLEKASESQKYAQQYAILNDSLNTAQLRVKNAFAKIKYDYTQEEQQKLKYKSEKEKAELLLEKRKTENLILFITVIGVAAISYLWYRLRRTREEAKITRERQEAIYTTETRLSKRVHDELANGVYNVMAQLGEESPNKEVLDKLEEIYTLTRDISRENTSIDTGPGFPEELASMLGSYPPGTARIVVLGLEGIPWQQVSAEKKIVLYRVLQELMTNMKKYSRASLVAITFDKTPKKLEVMYSDNGVGIPDGKLKYGSGLRNTENRILFAKGSITFDTDKGFRVKIQLPF